MPGRSSTGAGSGRCSPAAATARHSLPSFADIQRLYTDGGRRIASQSMTGLARTRLTPMALTVAGVLLCIAGSIVVHFQYRNHLLYFWLGAAFFLVGSILDILDGALARAGGKSTPFGAFVDSTTDRVGEAFMLGSIGLVFMREGNETALAFTFAALAGGTFLVSYTRARAEALGLRGDVGLASRAERVVLITIGLVVAPWGGLQWAIYAAAATAWFTVAQRIWSVRVQLAQRDKQSSMR